MLFGKIIKQNRQQQPHKIFAQQQDICKFGDHGRIMELAVHPEEETDIVIGECLTRDEAQDIISVLVRDGAVQGEDSIWFLTPSGAHGVKISVCLSRSKVLFAQLLTALSDSLRSLSGLSQLIISCPPL